MPILECGLLSIGPSAQVVNGRTYEATFFVCLDEETANSARIYELTSLQADGVTAKTCVPVMGEGYDPYLRIPSIPQPGGGFERDASVFVSSRVARAMTTEEIKEIRDRDPSEYSVANREKILKCGDCGSGLHCWAIDIQWSPITEDVKPPFQKCPKFSFSRVPRDSPDIPARMVFGGHFTLPSTATPCTSCDSIPIGTFNPYTGCNPLAIGACTYPVKSNGEFIQVGNEVQEYDLIYNFESYRISADGDPNGLVDCFTGAINDAPFTISIPCRQVCKGVQTARARLLNFDAVPAEAYFNSQWVTYFIIRHSMRIRSGGWDLDYPHRSTQRCWLPGVPDGSGGTVATIAQNGRSHLTGILDPMGNQVRDGVPMDANGQPAINGVSTYSRWSLIPMNFLDPNLELTSMINPGLGDCSQP